jgi:hypothetical protein
MGIGVPVFIDPPDLVPIEDRSNIAGLKAEFQSSRSGVVGRDESLKAKATLPFSGALSMRADAPYRTGRRRWNPGRRTWRASRRTASV